MLERAERASHIDPPASSYAIMQRASPYCGENPEPGKDVHGELESGPGIREQPGSKPVMLRTSKCFPVCPRLQTFSHNSFKCHWCSLRQLFADAAIAASRGLACTACISGLTCRHRVRIAWQAPHRIQTDIYKDVRALFSVRTTRRCDSSM